LVAGTGRRAKQIYKNVLNLILRTLLQFDFPGAGGPNSDVAGISALHNASPFSSCVSGNRRKQLRKPGATIAKNNVFV
jgi:hypothetical protein